MDKDILFLLSIVFICYLIIRKDNKEGMATTEFDTALLDKLSTLNNSNDILVKSNKKLIDDNIASTKEYNTRLISLEEKTSQLTKATGPGWGGWGEGITLNRPSHTSIYYPPGNMFIGMHSNRNLYIGNNKDGKYILTLNTTTGDLTVPGNISCTKITTTSPVKLVQDNKGDLQDGGYTYLKA